MIGILAATGVIAQFFIWLISSLLFGGIIGASGQPHQNSQQKHVVIQFSGSAYNSYN